MWDRPASLALEWLVARNGTLVHVSQRQLSLDDDVRAAPLCKRTAFVYGFASGLGASSAAQLNLRWCEGCLRRLKKADPTLVKSLKRPEQQDAEGSD